MRGKLEQQPMIIPIHSDSKSSASEASNETEDLPTPPSSDDERRDIHHSFTVEGNAKCSPATSEMTKNLRAAKQSERLDNSEADRGRRDVPKLNTEFARSGSTMDQPPRMERERSPYTHTPKESRPRKNRFSGDSLLSPEPASPIIYHGARARPRSRSQRPPQHNQHDSGSGSEQGQNSPRRPVRPLLDRRATAMPQLGGPTPTNPPRSHCRLDHTSSDESDLDLVKLRERTAHLSPESRSEFAGSYFDHHRHSENHFSSNHLTSPPRTPTAVQHPRIAPLNRDALLNDPAALQNLNRMLDSHHRKASPRSSPQPSRTGSPYPSPPRTPPEPYQHRMHPISGLKNDSPNSRPSSPLSSAPSSPKTSGPSYMSSRHGEQDARPQRYMPKASRTSPLPSPHLERPEPKLAPKIDVRSPSPAKHGKSSSYETYESRPSTTYMPAGIAGSTTLQPAGPERRQRSVSNAEARGSRPTLVINPPVVHQDLKYIPSPTLKVESPHISGTHEHKPRPSLLSPTTPDGRSRTSVADYASPSHRSRSSVPTPTSSNQRSASVMPTSRHRSRSSAPAPPLAVSDQPQSEASLPLCPRPDPVAGYNDWFTLDRCPACAICPDCRHNIFGTGYERHFKLRSPNSHGHKTHCDLNDPWMRMACIASIQSRRPDVNGLVDLARVSEDRTPCPQTSPADRDWYLLFDPEAEDALADFRICSHCVHSIRSLFPVLKHVFYRPDLHYKAGTPRLCSLRSDPTRFATYVDQCEKAAKDADRSGKKPDLSDFIWEHKRMTVIGECTRDQMLHGRDWHLHAQLPELTVCEECYYKTVRPAIKTRCNIAKPFTRVSAHLNDEVSCQLYSARMRQIFDTACEEDDLEYLKRAVLKRRECQTDMLAAQRKVQSWPRDKAAQRELDKLTETWRKLERKKGHDE